MAIRIPFGVDPDEVWEVDFCAESARSLLKLQEDTAASLRRSAEAEKTDPARRTALEDAAAISEGRVAATRLDLHSYVPESGPVFRATAIPGRRRAELVGRKLEVDAMPDGAAKAMAQSDWSREVVAAAVRGHRNLKRVNGSEIAYDSTEGRPSERTLDAYTPLLSDLAWVLLTQQRLGADAKNA